MNILGVRIDNLSKKEILERVESFLNEENPSTISDEKVLGKFHQIATVNPEFILQAQNDEEFRNILNNCDLNIADGVGIWYAFIMHLNYLKTRFAGVDLMTEILQLAEKRGLAIYLAINKNGLSNYSEISTVLRSKYPNLRICGNDIDIESHLSSACLPDRQVISHQYVKNSDDRLLIADDGILLCNFGSPEQEKFINLQKNGNIRLAMGVGGSFDFMTGKVKRAPKPIRFIGLEWLWRLLFHPSTDNKFIIKRIKRIFRSVVIFPIRVMLRS